jgi:hypothetical protein
MPSTGTVPARTTVPSAGTVQTRITVPSAGTVQTRITVPSTGTVQTRATVPSAGTAIAEAVTYAVCRVSRPAMYPIDRSSTAKTIATTEVRSGAKAVITGTNTGDKLPAMAFNARPPAIYVAWTVMAEIF